MKAVDKKAALFLFIVFAAVFGVLLMFGLSCGSSSSGTGTVKFTISIPYAALSTAEIVSLGADGFTGSDEAVANAILNWQNNKMKLVDPSVKADVSYAMRWNNIMPGIYPVKEIIAEMRMDDGGTEKIYGVCWNFAAIFNAIASYYGLEARVTAWKIYMSGVPGGEKGLSPTEYEAMKVKLQKNALNFTYDQINAVIKETYIHYRAEVKIDGGWKAFDGTGPTGEYANDANYQVASWDEGYSTDLAQK